MSSVAYCLESGVWVAPIAEQEIPTFLTVKSKK